MVSTFLYPTSGALMLASTIQTYLASSKLRLFQSPITLTPATTHAALVAAEATFNGYSAITVTAWQAAYLASQGGASISSGYQQWNFTTGSTTNMIYGFWLEDAAGNLVAAGSFDTPISMGAAGQSVPLTVTLNFGS
jgi:hypothetical protein